MRGVLAVAFACAALSGVATVAAATSSPSQGARAVDAAVSSTRVGPGDTVPRIQPVRPSSAGSQVVAGVTESTSAVQMTAGGAPVYDGTEPAVMTLAHQGASVIVTVTPR